MDPGDKPQDDGTCGGAHLGMKADGLSRRTDGKGKGGG